VIERVIAPLAEGYDGVVPGLALADTVKRVEGGVVTETVDRGSLVTVQTPQAFAATYALYSVATLVGVAFVVKRMRKTVALAK